MFGLEKIIPITPNYSFMSLRKVMLIVSSIIIVFLTLLLVFKGLNLGIDFKGGTLIEIKIKNSNISELRKILSQEFNDVSLQEFGKSDTIIIRLQNTEEKLNLSFIHCLQEFHLEST